MIVIDKISKLKTKLHEYGKEGRSIGFVPTMGYLHDGHISLARQSVKECDITVASIFVNPTQFGPNEDLESYPRDFDSDFRLLDECGVDILFYPSVSEMYPDGFCTYVQVEGEFTDKLCGASRPTHFKGVTTVVMKLLNITRPDRAYFGQKDAQQLAILRRMAKDMDLDTILVGMPIVREESGLAKSSRNVYLTPQERESASNIYKSLLEAKELIEAGERSSLAVRATMASIISNVANSKIDYIEIVDYDSFKRLNELKGSILIAVAVFVGKARLIDNILLEVK